MTKCAVCLTSGRDAEESICVCVLGVVSISGLIGGISHREWGSCYSELAKICGYMIEREGLNPSTGIVGPSIQVGFSPVIHTNTHNGMRVGMSTDDKCIIPAHTHIRY